MDEKQSQDSLDLGLFINDQYVTVKKIGQGAFGVVWQAYDFSLRNFVAIKELLSEYTEPKFVEMFYKEALIAKNIIHDNIVRTQHFWKGSNGSYYISMDFVRGVDLEDLIKRCNELQIKIPWELSVLITISMLKALDYANRVARDSITGKPYGIVYRDISPGNVLISFDGNVKLSDFGVAKTAEEISSGLQEKVVTGKYPYMSPEQIKGASDLDHRTDIFSSGVVFYEMITGKQLYTGENAEIKAQVLGQKFDTGLLSGLNIPYEIGEILTKALEKDREMRYERAIEMYRDLRRLLKGVETEELAVDLASFISKVMEKELKASDNIVTLVKSLDRQEIKSNNAIPRIICNDFIVGDTTHQDESGVPFTTQDQVQQAGMATAAAGGGTVQPPPPNNFTGMPQEQMPPQQPGAQGEAKAKTVFEEVGDWLVTKFKNLKSKLFKIAIAVIIAIILFLGIDVLFQITSFGKSVYSYINPPQASITTIPPGANVSMKSKDGEVVLDRATSDTPIPLRKVKPGTYVIVALKDGFTPVTRVIRIEEQTKENKNKEQKIEIMFDFMLDVNSEPQGADVYIDGNKFGVTPCKVQLMAGEHTVRLALAGYEDLGSKAKETKEGQCNIDFSKPNKNDMFTGVDKQYWETDLKNIDGKNVFAIKGHLFKKFTFKSEPENMIVHIEGESKPRGNTPLTANIKAGTYKVTFMDPEGRYGESQNKVDIDAQSPSELFVQMNKLITFRVRSKANASESFIANLTISGRDINTTRSIGTGKPITIPLPTNGTYNFTFTASDFKAYTVKGVDISGINSVAASLEYAPVPLEVHTVYMQNDVEKPLETYIRINDKIIGKTNAQGYWTKKYDPGIIKGVIISSGFIDHSFEVNLLPSKGAKHKTIMIPEIPIEPLLEPIPVPTTTKRPPKTETKQPKQPTQEPAKPKDEVQVVICSNCGYINSVPPGVKRRFCVNCAKPLK